MAYPEAQKALDKTKIQLMAANDTAFFVTVCFSLKHFWDERIPTACTNGLEIRFNPEFFLNLTQEERVGLLLHETLHVAFQHMTRLKGRQHVKWNYATDYVINDVIIRRRFQLPKGALYEPQYHGLTSEEVYNRLPDPPAPDPNLMDLVDPGESGGDVEAIKEEIDNILVRASIQSKMAGDDPGSIPGELQIYIDSLLKPKLPWYRILQKYITAQVKHDYTLRRPNKRFFPQHYLPTQQSEGLINLTWAVDCSGSVSDAEFQQFVSEGASILQNLKPEELTLLVFDTHIRSEHKLKTLQDLKQVTFTGRGGTDLHPVITWAREHKPNVLIVFTDGHFDTRLANPKIPVLWIIVDNPNFKAPFGRVIHYSMKK